MRCAFSDMHREIYLFMQVTSKAGQNRLFYLFVIGQNGAVYIAVSMHCKCIK